MKEISLSPGWVVDEAGALRRETIKSMMRRCRDWNYCSPCIYEITIELAVRGAETLGRIAVDRCDETGVPREAHCELTPLGQAIAAHWWRLGAFTPEIKPLALQVMPDHLHGILRVMRPMKRPLGNAIGGFKTGCEKIARRLAAGAASTEPPKGLSVKATPPQGRGELKAPPQGRSVPAAQAAGSLVAQAAGSLAAQAAGPRLFAPGFQDTILFHEGQLANMFNYLRDNPRRAAVKRFCPTLFKSAREIAVDLGEGRTGRFWALGNDALLRRELLQVQCSRKFFGYRRVAKPGGGQKIARDEAGEPCVAFSTPAFDEKRGDLLAAARCGAVLISPCISDGERQIAREAMKEGLRLVTLQNKGFAKFQKPAGKAFDRCAEGRLLMLAPIAWPYQPGEKRMTREDATALNRLAQWLAREGAAEVNYHGARPAAIDETALAACKAQRLSAGATNPERPLESPKSQAAGSVLAAPAAS